MADPIPRNSRADETAEFRRAEQERRGNRPLFGQGMAGGLRARIENAQAQPAARPANAPQAQPRPDPFARAAQPQQAPAAVRPQPRPQAQPRSVFALIRESAARFSIPRPPAAARPAGLTGRRMVMGAVGAVAGLLALSAMLNTGEPGVVREQPPPAAELTIDAPLIPVSVPATECSVKSSDVTLYRDAQTPEVGHALVVQLSINAQGCNNQFVRTAVWVYQAENMPMIAPDASPVYRSPIGQLSAQTLARVEGSPATLRQGLAIPHAQFPIAPNVPQWLTIGIQIWPEGQPAAAGSMMVEQVYFTRSE
ncbi:MAG: hypothetical protein IPK52_17510 [Chloroflexi bacterium]|nr:hypothetical protein [Chloroflexota bacterium]